MPLIKRPFAESFVFARTIAADRRDETGAIVTEAANVPRFDHKPDGTPLGLLVTAGPSYGQHDAIATVDGWQPSIATMGTVLHEYGAADGSVVRAAFYSANVKATADACLRAAVHHRALIVLDGRLRNRGGYVRHDARNWSLPAGLAVDDGPLASPALGDGAGRPLIEG